MRVFLGKACIVLFFVGFALALVFSVYLTRIILGRN